MTPLKDSRPRSIEFTDGSSVEFFTCGAGRPVIIVPGTLSVADDYRAFAALLGRDFEVHTLERRGRGGSSPQEPGYGIQTECADVLALQQLTGAGLIFGHSYGGLIALEASRRNADALKVAVYEPGVSVDGSIPVGWIENCEGLLASGRPLEAFARFSIGAGPRAARRMPIWLMKVLLPRILPSERLQRMLALLPTSLREHRVIGSLSSGHERYREISAEVLVMTGNRSGLDYVPTASKALESVVPNVSFRSFATLDHFGPDRSGPEAVAETVSAFFR